MLDVLDVSGNRESSCVLSSRLVPADVHPAYGEKDLPNCGAIVERVRELAERRGKSDALHSGAGENEFSKFLEALVKLNALEILAVHKRARAYSLEARRCLDASKSGTLEAAALDRAESAIF